MPDILSIQPMEDYRMKISLSNGSTIVLNLKTKLRTVRFSPLRDKTLFDGATTDGRSIRWNELIEISTTEIFDIANSDRGGNFT